MFSKVFVRLTGIFLILYISAISATPTGDSDSKAQNINDDIHARARPPYRPYRCQYPYAWMRRECLGAISPRAWQDVCGITAYHNQFQTEYDNQRGNCPLNTFCLDGFNADGKRFISCISNQSDNKGKRKLDPQAGVSEPKRARKDLGTSNTQLDFSVKLDHDMTGASVAAVVESEYRTANVHRRMFLVHVRNLGLDGKFLIAPNNVIVGNVHGYRENVCRGDKSKPTMARECYPLGKYNFKAGQTIDFTWGMTGDQEGKLVYGIIPAA